MHFCYIRYPLNIIQPGSLTALYPEAVLQSQNMDVQVPAGLASSVCSRGLGGPAGTRGAAGRADLRHVLGDYFSRHTGMTFTSAESGGTFADQNVFSVPHGWKRGRGQVSFVLINCMSC